MDHMSRDSSYGRPKTVKMCNWSVSCSNPQVSPISDVESRRQLTDFGCPVESRDKIRRDIALRSIASRSQIADL